MIRRILVPLDVSPYAETATRRACEIARSHSAASVTGMAVIDVSEILTTHVPIHAVLVPQWEEATAHMQKEAADRLGQAMEAFKATCEEEGVPYEAIVLKGAPATSILDASFYHDLVVIGLRTYFHFETQRHADGQSLKEILSATSTPVLAVPRTRHLRSFDHVLIAYDGSLNAARALRDFASFAEPYRPEITVLTAEQTKESAAHYLEQATAYLNAHGLTNVSTAATNKRITDAVRDDYLAWADLVVAGIYSRRHLADFFVGSFTKYLIERCEIPLFLG